MTVRRAFRQQLNDALVMLRAHWEVRNSMLLNNFFPHYYIHILGTIQVLRNADGGGGVSNFPEKNVTKV